MNKNKILSATFALLLVLGVGGCNDNTDEAVDTTEGGSTTSSDTTIPPIDGGYSSEGTGLTFTDEDYEDVVEETHNWSSTGEIDPDDSRYHILTCLDDGCSATKRQVHQVEAEDSDGLGHCTVCSASDLNIAGLTYGTQYGGGCYVTGYSDEWVEGNDNVDLYIPMTYNGNKVIGVGPYQTSEGNGPFSYNQSLEFIGIPEGVEYIGDYAFYAATGIVRCDLPSTLTEIGVWAFNDCDSLEVVNLPLGMTSVSEHAFTSCHSLTTLTIPSSVTSIGDYAFEFCSVLNNVTLPAGLTALGAYAFAYCYELTSIRVPSGVTKIEERTFMECQKLASITLPSTIRSIGDCAFASCKVLTSAYLNEELETLSYGAFLGCSNLVSVDLSSTIKEISERVFQDCTSLVYIVVPQSVKSIGTYCFWRVESLEAVYYQGTESEWAEISIDESENDAINNATIYYYSENYLEGAWHYEDGVPTLW